MYRYIKIENCLFTSCLSLRNIKAYPTISDEFTKKISLHSIRINSTIKKNQNFNLSKKELNYF